MRRETGVPEIQVPCRGVISSTTRGLTIVDTDLLLNQIEALCSRAGKERSGTAQEILAIIQGVKVGNWPLTDFQPDEPSPAKLKHIEMICAGPTGRNSRTAKEVLAIMRGEDLDAWGAHLPKP